MSRTYDELFTRELPCLGVSYDPSHPFWRWRIQDVSNDFALYSRALTFDFAVAMIRTAERQGDATADEASIAHYQAFRTFGWSVKAPALESGEAAPSRDVDGTSPDSNVVPIRRRESA